MAEVAQIRKPEVVRDKLQVSPGSVLNTNTIISCGSAFGGLSSIILQRSQ